MKGVSYQSVVAGLWLAWGLYWALAARSAKPTRWRESVVSELLHDTPLFLAGTLLLARPVLPALLVERFLASGPAAGALGTALVVAGLGLAVWARLCLGSNWSSAVTLKDRHTLIRSGPYRHVRHPIYSGLLLAVVGTALVVGEWRGLVALGLALVGLVYKSRLEERRLRDVFPDYDSYRKSTAALIPFLY